MDFSDQVASPKEVKADDISEIARRLSLDDPASPESPRFPWTKRPSPIGTGRDGLNEHRMSADERKRSSASERMADLVALSPEAFRGLLASTLGELATSDLDAYDLGLDEKSSGEQRAPQGTKTGAHHREVARLSAEEALRMSVDSDMGGRDAHPSEPAGVCALPDPQQLEMVPAAVPSAILDTTSDERKRSSASERMAHLVALSPEAFRGLLASTLGEVATNHPSEPPAVVGSSLDPQQSEMVPAAIPSAPPDERTPVDAPAGESTTSKRKISVGSQVLDAAGERRKRRNKSEKARVIKMNDTIKDLREELVQQGAVSNGSKVCTYTVIETTLKQLRKMNSANRRTDYKPATGKVSVWGADTGTVDFTAVIEYLPASIALFTREGIVIYLNAAFRALTNFDMSGSDQITLFHCTPVGGLPDMLQAMTQLAQGVVRDVHVPVRLPTRSGRDIHMTGTMSRVMSGDTQTGCCLYLDAAACQEACQHVAGSGVPE